MYSLIKSPHNRAALKSKPENKTRQVQQVLGVPPKWDLEHGFDFENFATFRKSYVLVTKYHMTSMYNID